MSDVNGLVVTDILGMATPVQKLIETVAGAIGKVYAPTHIRRMAKARADEIQIVSDSIKQNLALPIHYEADSVCINADDINQLICRAQNRALYQEINKQQNIENVISKAYCQLENEKEASDKPVDPEWINEFFDNIANVSSLNLQVLWAKLLAGEILKPGSFSLRTLATLKNLSQDEATLFTQVAPYILTNQAQQGKATNYFLLSNPELLAHNNISFGSILLLSEAGLVNESDHTMINFEVEPSESLIIYNGAKAVHLKNTSSHTVSLCYSVYSLTKAGAELFPIAYQSGSETNEDYMTECFNYFIHHGAGPVYMDPLPLEISAHID